MSNTIPLSLYIHFPWCVQKCPYCDFNSHALKTNIPEQAYIARLLEDLDASLISAQNRSIQSIFMGGGTPSLFSAGSINYLLEQINQRLSFIDNVEITLEANPGTVDEKNFRGFFEAGVNRLSLGIQSFNPSHLKILGRIHDKQTALRAIESAINAGFSNFNLDLMHGLPEQTLDQALADLEQALVFKPPHLSWYQLTIEPNTVFYKNPPALPMDDLLAEIQQQGENLLAANGYEHYEISAFAKPQKMSQHNLNYWRFGDYLGIGAGAHSKITYLTPFNCERSWRTRQPKDYSDPSKSMVAGQESISAKHLPFEFMMNAMRLNQVIPRELFETRTGLNWSLLTPTLIIAAKQKLINYNEAQIIVTDLGRRFLNNLLELFMPKEVD